MSSGLGVELELPTLTYESIDKDWNQIRTAEREALKGARLIPAGFAGGPQTTWKVTAEISPANLMTEIIVDGRNNKVLDDGGDASRLIGQEIVQYMVRLLMAQHLIQRWLLLSSLSERLVGVLWR